MLHVDRDAVICDLAETYHIYDYRALPVMTLAVLCCGLRDNSRIKMKMAGVTYIAPEFMLARCADALTLVLHYLTAKKGDDAPSLFGDLMTKPVTRDNPKAYEAAKDIIFERVRNRQESDNG